ncbi:MAG: hypothetical protein WBQ78_12965 [Gammaproteobacteria bacterium]
MRSADRVESLTLHDPVEIHGSGQVEGVTVNNLQTGKVRRLDVQGYEQLAEKNRPLGIAMNIELDMPEHSLEEVDCEDWLGNQSPNVYTV